MGRLTLSDDELRLVGSTALELRLTQMELCEEDQQTRQSRLLEQVNKALMAVPMGDREEFLSVLCERFPTWEDAADTSAEEPETKPVELDPESLLAALSSAGEKLGEPQRRELLARLQKAWGVKTNASAELSDSLVQAIRARTGLGLTDAVDLSRIAEAFTHLAEFVQVLEALGFKVWKTINPNTPARNRPIKAALARHLKGDPMASTSEELMELRSLLAAILGAVPEVGGRLHHEFLWRFSPTDIEEAVRIEGGSAFVSQEARCWRRYVKMATELEEGQVGGKLNQMLVKIIEPCLMSSKRRP